MINDIITIEDWNISFYRDPTCENPWLNGEVYGHPRFADGTPVQTTNIVAVDKLNSLLITKSGSRYRLGSVDEYYDKLFPNAKEILLTRSYEEGESVVAQPAET